MSDTVLGFGKTELMLNLVPAPVDRKMSVCGHTPMCFAHEHVAITHSSQLVGKRMHTEIDAVRDLDEQNMVCFE